MANQQQVPLYPYMFDPSQLSNQFSNFANKPLPATSYYGAPVNAGTGIPISSYQAPAAPAPSAPSMGTTLNTPPDNSAMIQFLQSQNQNIESSPSSRNPGGFGAGNNVYSNSALDQIQSNAMLLDQLKKAQATAPAASAASAAPAAPSNPYGSDSSQAYLSALANPDKVVTPGIPIQGSSFQPSSGGIDAIMNQMLSMQGSKGGGSPSPASYATGGTGLTGGGSNNGFLNALAALRGA